MYLLSQDKQTLIKFEHLHLSKVFGSYTINAYASNPSNFAQVGTYNSEEQAKQEFNHIMDALRQGETIYEVR